MSINEIQQYSLLGTQLINFQDLGVLALKLAIDIAFTFIVIRLIFYPIYKERDYVFASILINISVFLICFLMASVKLKIGFAFGLFAVLSILRYRTEQIPIREMTYMFVVIVIAVLNALSSQTISYGELFFVNVSIVLAIYFVENNFLHKKEFVKIVTYEKIELIKPKNYGKLISDLTERTGYVINKAEVVTINFLNDTAKLKIFYQYPEKSDHDDE